MTNDQLKKIRAGAQAKLAALRTSETPDEIARAWAEAAYEELARSGDIYLPLALRQRIQAAYNCNVNEYIDAVQTVSDLVKKPAALFSIDDHERSLVVFELNTNTRSYAKA